MTKLRPHPWIENLPRYMPGKAKSDKGNPAEKLSANESALGPSPYALEAYQAEQDKLWLYPDADHSDLRQAIADIHGLDADRIICGCGSDEILVLAAQAFAGPGDEILHSRYCFSMYPLIARGLGAVSVPIANDGRMAADVDGLLRAVSPKTRMVYLDNPNNPTGAYIRWDEVEALHAGLPDDVLLVLDAVYAESCTAEDYHAGMDLVARADNVLMARSFSKLYGLAGLRLGWGYGSPVIIDAIQRLRPPFNLTRPALAAGVAAVRDQDHLAQVVAHNARWRAWLSAQLTALGLEVVPSQTNFVLVRFPDDPKVNAEMALAYLADNGLLVRWLPNQGLADYLRISIGTEQQMHALVTLLTGLLS